MNVSPAAETESEQPGIGLLASSDFFFITRICDTARSLNRTIQAVATHAALTEKLQQQSVRLLIIDLDNSHSLLTHLSEYRQMQPQVQVIAFGSHVEVQVLKQARAAGCDKVVPRSQFTVQLAEWIQEIL